MVECTFGSIKSRGFDLERTGMTDPAALERLFGIVILAWLSCLQIGVYRARERPIRQLAHGRLAMSLIQYAAQFLVDAIRWQECTVQTLFKQLTRPLLPLQRQKSGVVGY